jgi:hypothetical protein
VYLFCNLTCLSSLCVFVLSFDLFIFVLCICSVIWLVYLRSVYLFCDSTCLSRTNTQNEDKQVKWQNKYTERRKTSQITEKIHRAKINKSNDLFIFVLCICSVIRLVYLRSVYLFCHLTCLSSTQSEDKQVKW